MNTTHLSILVGSTLIASGPVLAAEVPWPESCLIVERNPESCLIDGNEVHAKNVRKAPECHRTWQEACITEKQVTPDNVFQYPFNRWTLQNTNRFTRTASMLTERKEVYPIPKKIDANLLNRALNGQRYTIADYTKRSFTDAFVVVKNGELIAEWYGNGMSASKPHYAASITKSVTGLLAEILIEQGTLNEKKLVRSYVPELASSPFGDVTVRDVLDMKVNHNACDTSGVADEALSILSLKPAFSGKSVYKLLTTITADGPNDGNFHYASMTAEVAGWIITRAAKKPYEQLASDLLWSKLGLQDDIYIPVDPARKVFSSTGMTISARDLAKLGLMIINHGKVNGRQAFPPSVIDRLYACGDANAWRKGTFKTFREVRSYRSYWYQLKGEDHALLGLGVFGQVLYINPASNLVTVQFSSEPAQEVKEYDEGWAEIRGWLEESTKVPR